MKVNGVIFDLDGTLLDSMFIWSTLGEDYLISRGITPEKGLNEKFKNMSIVQAAEYYRSAYSITDSVEEIIIGVNAMIEHFYLDVVLMKDGVCELLELMQTKGINMCIATATDYYMAEAALKRNGIFSYFSGILTCTNVGSGKDSPVIFEKALALLGTAKADTLVFEDALYAIQTAKSAGFTTVAVYDDSARCDQEQIQEAADYYLTTLQDWRKTYD